MEAVRLFKSLDRNQRNTFLACFLGWSLDAFDFFLLTFVIVPMAHDFGTSIAELSYAITLTLAMRPLGAFIFGLLGDRFGRRVPLMVDVVFYSVMELLTAFSPNYTWLLIFRALYGIGMGGEWGLGASLAMESLPTKSRGLFSGILQQGYMFGYLFAALVYGIVFPLFGWRGLFVAGFLPALLVIYIRAHVPESPVWLRREHATNFWPTVWRELIVPTVMLLLAVGAFVEGYRIAAICVVIVAIVLVIRLKPKYWLLFIYVILLMTAFNALSHGTQDQYQTFLTERGLGVTQKSAIGIMYAFGAICGGVLVGHLSQKFGRRLLIVMAAICGLILIPAWVFSPTLSMLVAGGFLMQFMVQGAWGIVPVHLNELSPDAVRGTFPGFAYQLGNLFAANTAVIEARLADHYRMANGHPDYAKALAIFSAVIFLALIALAAFGPENRGKEF
ncbi:MAG TPA: MFS transporter [Candidatus Udaeobacter sp.]|nr:MFS transporter [Candidatus Udaeobacter sp.]